MNSMMIYLGELDAFRGLLRSIGYTSRIDVLNSYGTIIFYSFLIFFVVIIVTHHAHTMPWFQWAREHSCKLILPVSFIAIPVALIFAIANLGGNGLSPLKMYIGVLIAVLFFALQKWASTDSVEKQRLFMKIVQLAFSFNIALLYLYNGGKGIK